MDLISVIIPAYNAASLIGATIASVLRQSHENFELIVVDDGSDDSTGKVVRDIAARDDRVRLIQTPKRGVSAARNLAISQAKGDLIATIDADDLWHPNKLEWQLAALKAAGVKTGVVYCWSVGIDQNDKIILPAWNRATASGFVLNDIIASGILGNGSTPLIRREAIQAAGGYDESLSLCEDWKFYTALAAVCEFAVIPAFLTGYRLRDDSASLNVREMERAIALVTDWLVERWRVSDELLWRRRHVVNAYLAMIAIRERRFFAAFQYLCRALSSRPSKIFDPAYLRLFFMLVAHAAGFRIYRWDFWHTPDFVEFCSLHRSVLWSS